MRRRTGTCRRMTKETDISVTINLDGTGKIRSIPGLAFLTICWTALQGTDFLTWK